MTRGSEERKLSELKLQSRRRRRKARTQRPGEREESSGGEGQIKEEVTEGGEHMTRDLSSVGAQRRGCFWNVGERDCPPSSPWD